jgi:hypothetical protein
MWSGTGGNAMYFEQSPCPDSRVTLCTEEDKTPTFDPNESVFGQAKTKIDWQWNDVQDEKSYNTLISLFKTDVEANGGTLGNVYTFAQFKSAASSQWSSPWHCTDVCRPR